MFEELALYVAAGTTWNRCMRSWRLETAEVDLRTDSDELRKIAGTWKSFRLSRYAILGEPLKAITRMQLTGPTRINPPMPSLLES